MRLFVVFRTFDRIWTCKTYTRELARFEMDVSAGEIKLMFMVDHILTDSQEKDLYIQNTHLTTWGGSSLHETLSFYCRAHENFHPKIVRKCDKKVEDISLDVEAQRARVRRFSVPSLELNIMSPSEAPKNSEEVIYFVLPMYRCTIVLDAHVASSVSNECSRSPVFRKHFWQYLKNRKGFRNCVPEYECWTYEERNAWDNYLTVPYMIDLVAVWPKQKIDYSWNTRVHGLLNKHIVLEEGFAWLSTLGGAHSSLGEVFIYHAEKAGEISRQQLKLALELGNENMIARCYIFWSWSLLQQGQLRRCKLCVLNTWKFCQGIKGHDWMLEIMCKAVWCRLKYKRSLRRKHKCHQSGISHSHNDGGGHDSDKDSSKDSSGGNEDRSRRNNSSCPLCGNKVLKSTPMVASSVRVH